MQTPTPTEVYLLILFSKTTKVLQRGFWSEVFNGKKGENLKISRYKQKKIKMEDWLLGWILGVNYTTYVMVDTRLRVQDLCNSGSCLHLTRI